MLNKLIACLLVGTLAASAHAASWNEAVHGDLSNDRSAPSTLLLAAGINPVRGSFGAPDLDYLAVTVPQGFELSALRYGAGMVLGGVRSFIGVQAGAQMTVPPDTLSAAGLLGWAHFQDAVVGTNMLPDIGAGFGAIGFSGALVAGTYTLWIQEMSPEPGLAFSFDLEVRSVPEPGTAWLWVLGVVAILCRRSSRAAGLVKLQLNGAPPSSGRTPDARKCDRACARVQA